VYILTFEEFKIALIAEVTNLVGEEVDVHVHKVKKNNGIVLDAISILGSGSHSSPSIYINDLFYGFKSGKSLIYLARKVLEISEEQGKQIELPNDFFMSFDKIKHRICYRLINYERNQEILNEVPHEKVMNLAKVYYYYVEQDIIKNASIMIRKVDLVRWGIPEKVLKKCAEENTPKLLKWQFEKMQDMMTELLDDIGLTEVFETIQDDYIQLYVLTNESQYYGAACMLYPHVLEIIADRLDSHFFILPSSIHECIIMPDSGYYSKEYLSQMVTEINEEHLDVMEVLADKVYYYDKNVKAIMT